LKSYIGRTARLKDKVTVAQEETIPNTWNGTMLDDFDGLLSASRGFVSISWASCLKICHNVASALSTFRAIEFLPCRRL